MSEFSAKVVAWQQTHGRQDLPWQNTKDPYRVWLSEVMLQQTQVVTVLGYFSRFLERFPDVRTLAAASVDEVLALWSGLGYYSRARNLHQCAMDVVSLHGGVFPQNAQALKTLPGIGRSTAAAISSICFSERIAILDGNVKRVLTRHFGFLDDVTKSESERALWNLAEKVLPDEDQVLSMPRYTQGVMDLGAGLCSPKAPRCADCPLQSSCVALAAGNQESLPFKTRKVKRRSQSMWLFWLRSPNGSVWLDKRPVPGIWAGLHCLPSFDSLDALLAVVPSTCHSELTYLPVLKHVLTHRDLHLHTVQWVWEQPTPLEMPGGWIPLATALECGLPTPIRNMLAASST
jgi:A/G-specific adenine glycosylase